MTESYTQVPPDSTGKKLRSRQRTVGANTVDEWYYINQQERAVTFRGFATSFRTLGDTTTSQKIFTIENAAGSTVVVGVRQLFVQMDPTAILAGAPASSVRIFRVTTLPTGGTTLSKGSLDTALTSSASVVLRGATASDGGTATAITSTTPVPSLMHRLLTRLESAVGHMIMDDVSLLPDICATEPLYLRASEGLSVVVNQATAANNAATNHHLFTIQWDEFTEP
jgi:hypothetical protein